MDFISKKEYIVDISSSDMYEKHAIWCQCAIVGMFILAVASILSIQHITFSTDVYWSTIFFVCSTIEFIVAEHAPCFHIPTDIWVKIGYLQKTTVYGIVLTWSIYSREATWVRWFHIPASILIGGLLQNPFVVLAAATLARCVTSWDIPMTLLVTLVLIHLSNPNVVGKSIASKQQKQRFAIKAISIVLESILLWLVRCEQRFPNIVRWKPLVAAVLGIIMAVMWAEYNVMDTTQSFDCKIVKNGHGIAASLRAAKDCPVCRQCLTALDMESSFSDTNVL